MYQESRLGLGPGRGQGPCWLGWIPLVVGFLLPLSSLSFTLLGLYLLDSSSKHRPGSQDIAAQLHYTFGQFFIIPSSGRWIVICSGAGSGLRHISLVLEYIIYIARPQASVSVWFHSEVHERPCSPAPWSQEISG